MNIHVTYMLIFCVFLIFCVINIFFSFFFNDPATTEIYTLSLHYALPISTQIRQHCSSPRARKPRGSILEQRDTRSEEHTSELQSHHDLVCRLLLEKKKKITTRISSTTTKQTNIISVQNVIAQTLKILLHK